MFMKWQIMDISGDNAWCCVFVPSSLTYADTLAVDYTLYTRYMVIFPHRSPNTKHCSNFRNAICMKPATASKMDAFQISSLYRRWVGGTEMNKVCSRNLCESRVLRHSAWDRSEVHEMTAPNDEGPCKRWSEWRASEANHVVHLVAV